MWRSRPPAQSRNSTVPLRNLKGWLELSAFPGGVSGFPDWKAQKPAAPSLTEEIHASTEVTFSFWSWPHSFLRCFPPDGSRILSCDRTIPLMYVRTRRNLRGGYWSWPHRNGNALGSFACRRERRSSGERLTLLVYFRLPLATVFSFTSQCANERRSTATETCFVSAGRSRTRANPLSSFGWARNLGLTGPYLHLRKIGARTRSAVASRMPPNFRVLLLPRAMTSRLAASGASGTLRNSALETRSVRKSIRA